MDEKIREYFELLKKWNSKMNLMSVADFGEFEAKHIEDARELLPYLEDAKTIVDLGTGAGIPGILIKILKPGIKAKLVEATRRKVSFCEEVVRKLELQEIDILWGRADEEDTIRKVGTADAVVSRATWDLNTYLNIAHGYISEGGICIAMKGARWNEELEAAANEVENTKLTLEAVHEYTLTTGEKRAVLVFKKTLQKP